MSEEQKTALLALTLGIVTSIIGNLVLHWLQAGYQRLLENRDREGAERRSLRQELTKGLDSELARLIFGALIETRLRESDESGAEYNRRELTALATSGRWLDHIGCSALYFGLLVYALTLKLRAMALVLIFLIAASLTPTVLGVLKRRVDKQA